MLDGFFVHNAQPQSKPREGSARPMTLSTAPARPIGISKITTRKIRAKSVGQLVYRAAK
jgi:hypothetical protein